MHFPFGRSQDLPKKPYVLPVAVSVFNERHRAALHLKFPTLPIHLGVRVKVRNSTTTAKARTAFTKRPIGVIFTTTTWRRAHYLNTEISLRVPRQVGLAFETLLGVGNLHTSPPRRNMPLATRRILLRKRDKAQSAIMLFVGLGSGLLHPRQKHAGTKIFLRYQAWAEYPFSPDSRIPPHDPLTNLHLGVKFSSNRSPQMKNPPLLPILARPQWACQKKNIRRRAD